MIFNVANGWLALSTRLGRCCSYLDKSYLFVEYIAWRINYAK